MNQPFGSRIVTPSGILLNSQILDFSWPNKSHSFAPPNPVLTIHFLCLQLYMMTHQGKSFVKLRFISEIYRLARLTPHLFSSISYWSCFIFCFTFLRVCGVSARLQHNIVQPGKRPLSFLMPTAVRPSLGVCGTYVALGSSNGDRALSGITQVQQLCYTTHTTSLSVHVASGKQPVKGNVL